MVHRAPGEFQTQVKMWGRKIGLRSARVCVPLLPTSTHHKQVLLTTSAELSLSALFSPTHPNTTISSSNNQHLLSPLSAHKTPQNRMLDEVKA